nr:hypothetical protein [Tanacetum cinerariifolium]
QRVKKLERKNKLKVSGLRRLRKVGTAQRVESSVDTVMDDQKDASKQGEIIANIDVHEDVTLKDVAVVEKTAEIEENADVQGRLKDATITAATTPITAAPSAARRRKRIVIRDPKETATTSIIIHSEPKSKDKGKGILVEEPKPLKKQAQIEQDEAYAREALKRASESQAEKAAKKQKLDEEVEELKKHIQIVPNDEDEVYTKATPLARKVPIVDYEIYTENNKPYNKIIRADGYPQLILSFLSLQGILTEKTWSSSMKESKECSWISKGQNLETVRVSWSAHHNIYNYTDDLAGREIISTNKGLRLLVEDLLLPIQIDAADIKLRLLEQSAAVG